MKKLIIVALLFAACKSNSHDGTYINHTDGPYSIADDTLIVTDTLVTNHTGYQKIRNRQTYPIARKMRKWTLNSPDAPVIHFKGDQIIIGQTIYHKVQ